MELFVGAGGHGSVKQYAPVQFVGGALGITLQWCGSLGFWSLGSTISYHMLPSAVAID
jgi:hypothetical protein